MLANPKHAKGATKWNLIPGGRICSLFATAGKLPSVTSKLKPGWRNGDPERCGGFQVDRQFEFGWSLDRQVARLGTLEDAIDVAGRVPVRSLATDAPRLATRLRE
jgi:hypothetical protein